MQLNIKQLILEGHSYEEIVSDILENAIIMNRRDSGNYLANNNTVTDSIGNVIPNIVTLNPIGLAANVVGNAGDRQYIATDKSGVQSKIGPWDRTMIARVQTLNNLDNNMSKTYENNRAQYFLNPFVGGPITHGAVKSVRSSTNGLYKMLKNKNAPDVSRDVTVASDTNKGAFNSGLDVRRNTFNNHADDVANIRRNTLGHYVLNPFVSGPTTELMSHVGGAISQGERIITSPNSKSGDTLVHNVGRGIR